MNDNELNEETNRDDYFIHADEMYYGSETHQMLGDAWFYRDCPGAW